MRTVYLLTSVCLTTLMGCAYQRVVDEKIYTASTLTGTNYYRVRITSDAVNSVADYRVGLYPAYAVDLYLNGVSGNLDEAATTENDLRNAHAAMVKKAYEDFIKAATAEEARTQASRLLRLQQVPVLNDEKQLKDLPMEDRVSGSNLVRTLGHNEMLGLADHSANKKLVIALSSDPDAILEQIAAFAEEPATTKALTDAFTGFFALSNMDALKDAKQLTIENDRTAKRLSEIAKLEVKNLDQLQGALTRLEIEVEGMK